MVNTILHPYTEAGAWGTTSSGLRTRGLPDRLPVVDLNLGFRPPFSIDMHDAPTRDSYTFGVCGCLLEAARAASRRHRMVCHKRSKSVEITDAANRRV